MLQKKIRTTGPVGFHFILFYFIFFELVGLTYSYRLCSHTFSSEMSLKKLVEITSGCWALMADAIS